MLWISTNAARNSKADFFHSPAFLSTTIGAVAAASAELIHADMLFNATNVEGVYDRNPEKPDAKKLESVTISQLREILSDEGIKAGQYNLFDPVAIRIVERSQILTVIFNGNKPENLKKVFNKEKIGTRITHGMKK